MESKNIGIDRGRYRNQENARTGGGETRGEEAGSRAGQQIAYAVNPPTDSREDRVEKR
jgi:hypothetical protein